MGKGCQASDSTKYHGFLPQNRGVRAEHVLDLVDGEGDDVDHLGIWIV